MFLTACLKVLSTPIFYFSYSYPKSMLKISNHVNTLILGMFVLAPESKSTFILSSNGRLSFGSC